MRKPIRKLYVVLVVLVLAAAVFAADKARSQTAGTFMNTTQEEAFGLHVMLTGNATVIIDDKGMAGPFKEVSKNGTPHIILAKPEAPIKPGDKIELSFSSPDKSIAIQKWWWMDAKGKKLGGTQKG